MNKPILFSLVFLSVIPAAAAPLYTTAPLAWDAGSASGWSAVSSGPYGSPWVNGEEAVFEGASGVVTYGAGLITTGLTFNAGGVSLSGGLLTLGGNPRIRVGSGLAATVTGALGAANPVDVSGGGTVALQPAAGNNDALAGGLRVAEAGTLVTLAGNNAGGSVAGAGALVIGSGSVVRALSHNPLGQLTGSALSPLVINGGTFEASEYVHVNSVTMTGGLLGVRAGAAQVDGMDMGNRGPVAPSVSVLSSGSTALVSSLIKMRGTVVFDVADSPSVAEDLRLNAAMTNAGGATKRGPGVMVLNAANSFAGELRVEQGTVRVLGGGGNRLPGNKRVVVAAGAAFESSDNTNNTPTAGSAIDIVLEGGDYRFTGAGNAHQHIRNLTFNGGGAFLTAGTVGLYQNHNVQLNGTLTVTGAVAAVVNMANGIGLNGSHDLVVHDVTGGPAADLVFSGGGGLRNSDANNGAVVKRGTGTVLLSTIGSFTAGLTVEQGVFAIDANQEANRLPANAQVRVRNAGVFEVRGVNASPGNATAIDVTAETNGVFRVVAGASAATSAAIASHLHLRNLTLRGGRFEGVYSGSGSAYDGESVLLHGTVTVGGTQPSLITSALGNGLQGLALNGQRTFDVADVTGNADADLTVAMELENAGGILKTGAGTLRLVATNTYSGATTVDAGTLRMDGRHEGAGAVTVNAAGTLSGAGVFPAAAVTVNGGVLAPACGTGGPIIQTALTMGPASTLRLVMSAPGQVERVTTSALALDGTQLDLPFGFTPSPGDSFTLVDVLGGGPVGGSNPFFVLNGNPLAQGEVFTHGGAQFVISYTGGDGNDVVIQALSAGTDTDNDGLPDLWEIAQYGAIGVTDAQGDTDGDGRRSLLEFALATSPTNANANADLVIRSETTELGEWSVLAFRQRIQTGLVLLTVEAGLEPGTLSPLPIDGVNVIRTVVNPDVDGDGVAELVELRVLRGAAERRLYRLRAEVALLVN